MVDWAFFLLRVVLGLLFIGHGTQKLFGWFSGKGYRGTARYLKVMGFRPARAWAGFVGGAELVGGALVLVGFFNPIGPLIIVASRIVAISRVYWPRLWAAEGGFEYPLMTMATALAIAIAGPGLYSLDSYQNITIPNSDVIVPWLFALTVFGAFVGLASSFSAVEADRVTAEPPLQARKPEREGVEPLRRAA